MSWSFEEGRTRTNTEAGVLAFKEAFFWTRTQLHPTWRRLREWRLREPVEMRNPATEEATAAMMSTALAWGW